MHVLLSRLNIANEDTKSQLAFAERRKLLEEKLAEVK